MMSQNDDSKRDRGEVWPGHSGEDEVPTTAVSLLGTLIGTRKRECRSTNVASSCAFHRSAEDRLPNGLESLGLPPAPVFFKWRWHRRSVLVKQNSQPKFW